MSSLALWSALVGVLLPPGISIIQQATWPKGLKSVVAVVLCAVAAAITALLQTDLTVRHWETAFWVIFVATMTAYEHFWKPIGVAPAILLSTSRGGRRG